MPWSVEAACVGGGVIGLMTALRLQASGRQVAVFDQGPLGAGASWAGAGIIGPAPGRPVHDLDRLRARSSRSYPQLAEQIRATVGIDIGLRSTGGVFLDDPDDPAHDLQQSANHWRAAEIDFEPLTADRRNELEPMLRRPTRSAYWLPGVQQVRNPWLIRGLTQMCQAVGIRLLPGNGIARLEADGARVAALVLQNDDRWHCDHVILTAGAWSTSLLAPLGVSAEVIPVRGQILALQTAGNVVRHIVEVGRRYLVPRDDGLVLIGATEEAVGFVNETTGAGIAGLRDFALEHFPSLADCPEVSRWSGLRPARAAGPVMGPAPGWDNLWLAIGHFRQGVQLAPGVADVMTDLILRQPSFLDPASFSLTASPLLQPTGFVN